jgi:hypothetical protein
VIGFIPYGENPPTRRNQTSRENEDEERFSLFGWFLFDRLGLIRINRIDKQISLPTTPRAPQERDLKGADHDGRCASLLY